MLRYIVFKFRSLSSQYKFLDSLNMSGANSTALLTFTAKLRTKSDRLADFHRKTIHIQM